RTLSTDGTEPARRWHPCPRRMVVGVRAARFRSPARLARGVQVPDSGPVLVVGPGAIGSLVAARLADAGTEVVLACRTPAAAAALSRSGVVAVGLDGHGAKA